MRSASVGANKQRRWWYELMLFTAWHMAAFNSQAKAGKLDSWDRVRQKLGGADTPKKAPTDWRILKAESQRQVAQFQKHQAVKTRPPRRRHGQ